MSNFSRAQNILLSMLGHNLFSVPFVPEGDVDWTAVLNESKLQSVTLVAFNNYKEFHLDEQTANTIKNTILQYTRNNIICFRNHAYLHSIMTKNNISYCVVKGAASAHYYPDPLLRAMGDVDYYVHPDDIDSAKTILTKDGFERKDINHRTHVVLRKGNMHFEMHFKPIGRPNGNMGYIIDDFWRNIRESSILMTDELTSCRCPSDFHHGLILLSHFQHHLLGEGVGLRHLCDWAVFANSFSNSEFVDLFEEKLKSLGLWRLATTISLASVKFLGMPYKEWMGDDYSTATELMSDIMVSGNFGRKDAQRAYESFFISNHGVDGVKTNRVIQAIKSINALIDNYWKSAKKFPILYPVGWVYFSVRYLIRLISGKRKLDIFDTYKKSGQRKELYKKLNLFEPPTNIRRDKSADK